MDTNWIFGFLIVLVVIGCPTACTMDVQRKNAAYDMDQNRKIAEAAARGDDPIAMKCALGGFNSGNVICTIYAASVKAAPINAN